MINKFFVSLILGILFGSFLLIFGLQYYRTKKIAEQSVPNYMQLLINDLRNAAKDSCSQGY